MQRHCRVAAACLTTPLQRCCNATCHFCTAGINPILAALSLGFTSNLFGAISHYASGQAAIYFGSGYLDLKQVFYVGAVFAVLMFTVWFPLGFAWWKVIGLV